MADIDKDSPQGSDPVSQYPQNERDSRGAIETIFQENHEAGSDTAQDGRHKLVNLIPQATPSAVSGEGLFYTKDVGSGQIELFWMDAAGNEVQVTNAGGFNYPEFSAGTKMVFYQASPPTGWTQDTTAAINGAALRGVTGSGGGSGGSNDISGISAQGHVLTVSEMPNHNHGGGNHNHSYLRAENTPAEGTALGNGTYGQFEFSDSTGASGTIVFAEGGDSPHSHSIDPKTIDVIVATKD